MKKIISLIIAAAMLVTMLPVFAQSNAAIPALCEETGLLQALGVYSQSDANDTSNKAVTRGEFAVYAARLLSLDEEAYVNTRYFKDVPSSRREAGAINALNDRGIMIGTGNYEFDIDGAVTPTDATNILLKITGYPKIYLDNKPMPRKTIMAGVEGLQTVTKRQLATMIYNMLSLPYLDITGITPDNAQFEVDENYTVMEALFDVYRVKGRLTAAEGTGISSFGVNDNSTAVIDNVIYKNEASDAYESIGMYVSAYVKVTKETEGMNTLVFLWTDTTDVIEIKADYFGSVSGNYLISYTAENGSRVRTVSLPSNVKVIKNGALEKDDIKGALDIKNGSMKLIKNDKGVYDVAIVWVFESAMVTAVDTQLNKIYVKDKTPIDLSDEFRRIKVFDENGNEIALTDLRAGKFISYFISDVSAKIYVCDKVVSGKIEGLSVKSDRVSVTVAGQTVFVDNDYYKANKAKFQTGVNGTFHCDYDGRIAYAVKGGAEGMFAFVLGVDVDDMSDVLTLGVYDQSGEFMELKTSGKKISLDGVRVSGKQAYNSLTSNGKAITQLVRYKTTSDGKLNFIDTIGGDSRVEGENTLEKTVDAKSLVYLPTSKSMGVILPIGPNTVVMQIPKENGQVSLNRKDYSINPTFVGYDTYTVDGYTTNPDSIFPDVVVSGLVEAQDSVSCYVFDSKYETVNAEGDKEDVLKLGGEKGVENLIVSSDFVVSDADRLSGYVSWNELGEGDVVRILQNGRGEVTKIGLVLDYDKDTSINTNMLSYYGQYEKWNTENFGFVKKVESGYYKYGERDNDAKDEILPLTSNTIVVFDSSKPEDKVYMGSEKDIYSKEEVGPNASAILTNQKNGISVFTIVFKNGDDLFKVQ